MFSFTPAYLFSVIHLLLNIGLVFIWNAQELEAVACGATFQQDILLSEKLRVMEEKFTRRRVTRAVTSYPERLWTNGKIPYVIDSQFTNRTEKMIQDSMTHWMNHTCIKFVPRTQERDYVYIYKGSGCCSYVGLRGGRQLLSIGVGCETIGVIVHEFGHVIGFWHEQSRPDRDDYVDVLYRNIHPKDHHNFKKMKAYEVNSMDQIYDYRSIMHYGPKFFSRNGQNTLHPKQMTAENGLRPNLGASYYFSLSEGKPIISKQDIIQTNLMYKCDGQAGNTKTIFSSEGIISSPGYPKPYPKSQTWDWVITTDPGPNTSLTAIFHAFDVGVNDASGLCQSEHVEVRGGKGLLAPFITRVCGRYVPDPITIMGNSMYLKLFSDKNIQGDAYSGRSSTGFIVRYKTDHCSHTLSALQGTFTSPRFPYRYPSDTDCVWLIKAPHGYQIKLRFDKFLFRVVDNNLGCLDYIEIRDGKYPLSTFRGRFCGDNKPGEIVSQSNYLRVQFHSSKSRISAPNWLFSAVYETIDIDECAADSLECEHGCWNYPGGYSCGCRTGYKFIYPNICVDLDECEDNNGGCSHQCTNTDGGYFCSCPSGFSLSENNTHCLDVDECKLHTCNQNCKNTPGSFHCSCYSGYILDEDGTTCRVLQRCGGKYILPVSEFRSPNIPSSYKHNVDCYWSIEVREKHTIGLYLEVTWQREEMCRNSIEIRFGEGRDLSLLKLCGKQDIQNLLHIKSNHIWVHYSAKPPFTDGFVLKYDTRPPAEPTCGGVITSAQALLNSPGYPYRYPNKVKCTWIIRNVSTREEILEFESFELEHQSECLYDYLDIEEKDNRYPTITKHVGKFCGQEKPSDIIIFPNKELWIKFFSDSTVQRPGFKARLYTDQ